MPTPDSIAEIIRLAVAPVFLLVGIGTLLAVLTARLGRVVDRVRVLEDRLCELDDGPERRRLLGELPGLEKRLTNANRAISLATVAELLACLTVILLFIAELIRVDLSNMVAGLFILCMVALSAGLCFFLAELFIANRMLHVRGDVLALAKPAAGARPSVEQPPAAGPVRES